MRYDKAITIQRRDPNTEEWSDAWNLHARVNKTNGGQAFDAGADQYRAALNFDVRYFADLVEMRYNPQPFRIVYQGHFFKIVDYDDYQEQHRTVRLVGEAYG